MSALRDARAKVDTQIVYKKDALEGGRDEIGNFIRVALEGEPHRNTVILTMDCGEVSAPLSEV